jgi:hypothetical protein
VILDVAGEFGIPLDRLAEWRLRLPVRPFVAIGGHRFEMAHEPRQVFKVAPEAVKLIGRLIDRQ